MGEKTKKYPKVGIGVMIQNDKGDILIGLRKGSHGAGEWGFPGGCLEYGETIFEAARREVMEEAGLVIDEFELISVVDEMRYIESDGKHYLGIGVRGEYIGGDPQVMEVDKCLEWRWCSIDNLPENLFEGTELVINNYLAKRIY